MKSKTYTDLKEWLGWNTPEVAPIATPQAVDDVDTAAFAVEQPDVLDKLNAYCHDITGKQYMNPYYPLNALWRKLNIIGLNFDPKKILLTGTQGRIELPLTQYGGRFGALGGPFAHFISSDDGISGRVPGGLKMVITYTKTGGVYSLDATIEHGSETVDFGEEVEPVKKITEDDGFSLAAAKATRQAYKTGKKEDHVAAMKAHLAARGGEFAPQPPKGSNFQPNVDRWKHHDKQAKMHKSEITEEEINEFYPAWEHPFHSAAINAGFLPQRRLASPNRRLYINQKAGKAIFLHTGKGEDGSGKPTWTHIPAKGEKSKGKNMTDVEGINHLVEFDIKKK